MNRYYLIISFVIIGTIILLFNLEKKDNPSNLQETNKIEIADNFSEKKIKRPSGYLEYRNKKYNFYLFYPRNFSIKEQFLVDDAIIIVFEDIKNEKGFQIFILPYKENEITEERFKKDMPSGIRNNLETIEVDGALGASFYGFDEALGETKEIWFINKGFLYEISTLKTMESITKDLIKYWKFIK